MESRIIEELDKLVVELDTYFDIISERVIILDNMRNKLYEIKKFYVKSNDKYKIKIALILGYSIDMCNKQTLTKVQLIIIKDIISILNSDVVNRVDFLHVDDLLISNDLEWILEIED